MSHPPYFLLSTHEEKKKKQSREAWIIKELTGWLKRQRNMNFDDKKEDPPVYAALSLRAIEIIHNVKRVLLKRPLASLTHTKH